jgi:hypothetical protein
MISTMSLLSTRDNGYVRPEHLSEGSKYTLMDRQSCGRDRPVQETVQFVSYTACPGTVIVLDSGNRRFCTLRDRLFFTTPTSGDFHPITNST